MHQRDVLRRLVVGWVVVLLAAGGCKKGPTKSADPAEASPEKARKKTITIGITQEPDTLFMPFREMAASEEVARPTAYTLTIYDENWTLVPWAAKSIPTPANGGLEVFEEDGQKKMRTTWVLKDEFNWPDGQPLTADDFILTFEIYKDETQEIIDRTVVEKIEKMEAAGDDKKTLVVTWKEPYAYYATYRQHEALPAHVVRPLYNQHRGDLKRQPFGTKPLLAGAFTIAEWVPGSHVIARKNPHAKGFLTPQLDEIIWRIIPQTNTLEANLVSGTIDAVSTIGLSFDQAVDFEKRHGKDFDVHFTEGLIWEHIDFNLDNEVLQDLRVRKALAHGANREAISKKLFAGKQPVAHGSQPRRSPFHNPNIATYPFDVAKAGALLDEAGWTRTGDGIRQKGGKPLTFTLMTTAGNKVREKVQALLQADWRELGVDVKIKNEPAKVLFGETLRHRKFEGGAMFAWMMDPGQLLDTLWRCDYVPSEKNKFQGQNFSGWCHPEADQLLKDMSTELDEKKRIEMAQRIEALMAEQLPTLPLYFRVDVSATKKGLQNWKPTGTLQPVTWNAHEWVWN